MNVDIDREYGGKAPWFVRTAFFLLCGFFLAYVLLLLTMPNWAPDTPDFEHTVEFQMKNSRLYHLSPGLGWLAKNGVFVVMGYLLLLIAFVKIHAPFHRERMRRESSSGVLP